MPQVKGVENIGVIISEYHEVESMISNKIMINYPLYLTTRIRWII